jgi:hypothetical protein
MTRLIFLPSAIGRCRQSVDVALPDFAVMEPERRTPE